MTEISVIPGGTPKWIRDATANDSDKSFTVPAGKRWVMKEIYAELAATATVGNRTFLCSISDGTNIIMVFPGGGSVTANQKGMWRYDVNGNYNATVRRFMLAGVNPNVQIDDLLPCVSLPAGYVIRCYDTSAIDAAADDLTVILHYIEYEA